MRVNETFYSLQGEGTLVGTPSVFIRLVGCPLHCRWCDTRYAWDFDAGEDLEPAQIVDRVSRWPCRFIVLTGGEPMVGPDLAARAGLADLTHRLHAMGKHIAIETSGILFIPDLACDLMSVSPKLSTQCLGLPESDVVETLRQLMRAYPYQLKFVVESPEDMDGIQSMLRELGPTETERVMLMPQAATAEELHARSAMVAELCKQTGLRFGQRLHLQLWGPKRGV